MVEFFKKFDFTEQEKTLIRSKRLKFTHSSFISSPRNNSPHCTKTTPANNGGKMIKIKYLTSILSHEFPETEFEFLLSL